MSDLIDAINKVSGNTDPAKAKLHFEQLDQEFFQSEVKPTVVPQAQAVQQTLPSNAQTAPAINGSSIDTPTQAPAQPVATNTTNESLDSKAAIALANVVLSRLLQAGFAFGGIETKATDFQLTENEKAQIEPTASILLKKYTIGLSPEWLFAITVISIYGAKIITVLPEGKAKGELKKARIASTKDEASRTYTGAKRGRKSNAEREKLNQ